MSDLIRAMLSDPEAPWYGSDLVSIVADWLELMQRERAAAEKLAEMVLAFHRHWHTDGDGCYCELMQAVAEYRALVEEREGRQG